MTIFSRWTTWPLFFLAFFSLSSCNYNYHVAQKLEQEKRYEAANLEYWRAFVADPEDQDFKDSYQRTSTLTVIDMQERYQRYIPENQLGKAYHLLQQALFLEPKNAYFLDEEKKWYQILLVGKMSFNFQSLVHAFEIAGEMTLAVRFNTPNQDKRLFAKIDVENGMYVVEDFLYNPPQDFLMFYSINSIGIELTDVSFRLNEPRDPASGVRHERKVFQNFINYRVPVLVKTDGSLEREITEPIFAENFYPQQILSEVNISEFTVPATEIQYSIKMKSDRIEIDTTNKDISFAPQILYLNEATKHALIDFGHIQVSQFVKNGGWGIRRQVDLKRDYFEILSSNILFRPYFYYTGGYPFVRKESQAFN